MNNCISFIESLTENIEDWFYSNHKRACYDAVDDYIDDTDASAMDVVTSLLD